MKSVCVCWAVLLALLVLNASATEVVSTFAERLGWPAGARVVIFHNDDTGLCHEANQGTIIGMEQGLITSASVMMPCSWVPEFAAYLKAHPEVCSGLHLTLTSEWENYRWRPVACPEQVPGLVDEQGCLWDNVELVTKNASVTEVETEIRAQIALAKRMGLPITHLDTHMGTVFARKDYLEAYIRVGMEMGIPVMVPGGHMELLKQTDPQIAENMDAIRVVAEMVWLAGLPVLDDISTDSYDWKTTEKTSRYAQILRDLKPGVTQIILHATDPTPVFDRITMSAVTRKGDLNAMIDPELRKVVEEEGIILTNWRELKARRDALK